MEDINVDLKESISSELRSLRAKIGLTTKEVAIKSKVNKDTIVRYENNKTKMNIDILSKLLFTYNVPFDIFFTNVDANMQNK